MDGLERRKELSEQLTNKFTKKSEVRNHELDLRNRKGNGAPQTPDLTHDHDG